MKPSSCGWACSANSSDQQVVPFWLVFGGCGTAIFAGEHVGFIGVAFAFGLTVLTMAYAVGHISGGNFNPAVTIGVALAKRFDTKDVPAYVITQIVGAVAAAVVLFAIASGLDGFSASDGFAANGYGDQSPLGYALWAVLIAEVVCTAFFLYVILGSTDTRAPQGLRAAGDRPGPDAGPPDLDPDQQHLGQPGPFDQPGALRRR